MHYRFIRIYIKGENHHHSTVPNAQIKHHIKFTIFFPNSSHQHHQACNYLPTNSHNVILTNERSFFISCNQVCIPGWSTFTSNAGVYVLPQVQVSHPLQTSSNMRNCIHLVPSMPFYQTTPVHHFQIQHPNFRLP